MRKHGGTPPWRDQYVTLALISPPSAARGRYVWGHRSDLAGCKRLPFSCAEPLPVPYSGDASGYHGAPLHDRVQLPTYLPLRRLVRFFCGKPGTGELRTWKQDLMRALILSDINSPRDQVTALPLLLDGNTIDYHHSLTKQVQDDLFKVMRVFRERPDCISHEPVYLPGMLMQRESEFPRHADYVKEFRTCAIKSKVNTSDIQIGYLANSRFVERLSNDAVRQHYIVEVRSK